MNSHLLAMLFIVTGSVSGGGGNVNIPYIPTGHNATPFPQTQSQYPVYYVYPVPVQQSATLVRVPPSSTNVNFVINREENDKLLQKALNQAWDQYGPKSKQRVSVTPLDIPSTSQYAHRDTAVVHVYTNNQENSFQPWKSEWDEHVTKPPPANREVLQPGFFNRLLASYIDFEVNYHEVADFVRRAVVVVFIGVVIILWISVGIYIGLFPLKWLYFLGVGRKIDAEGRVGEYDGGNDLMSELTDRIFLALDGDWLKKLEERIKKGESRGSLKTHVQCCILPDAKTKGMADCQLVLKRAKKQNTFKCLSDLIYNFQF